MKKFAKSVSTVSLLTATAMLLAVTKYEDVQGSSLENDILPTATVEKSTLETSGLEKIIFASAIETDVEEETENTTNSDEMYSNTVYCVGEDIPADSYVITCTNTDYSMEVVVFSDETEYDDFLKAEKNTVGKYRNALEAYAWTNYYLYENKQIYVNLKEGNILLLDDGMCEFSRYTTETSSILYSGLYIAGEDIVCEKMNIKCTSDYLTVTVFDNTEDYLAYHKTDRFTVGEESDAIAEYSASNDFIYNDYSTYVNLQEGMILMIEDGTGEYSVDAGPVIN